jgi:hypothetical protein
MHAKGMTTRDIQAHIKDLYHAFVVEQKKSGTKGAELRIEISSTWFDPLFIHAAVNSLGWLWPL